ncbi:MAG: hypothetical protein IIC79_05605 [Chloroflexi bacterium]|nr:hypothetical protein [Chloroflexota bacterium]
MNRPASRRFAISGSARLDLGDLAISPQPLSSVKRSAVVKWGDQDTFEKRPELAIMVIRAIAGWAHAEGFMREILVRMLGARAEPAAKMYAALRSSQVQISALSAAAECTLSPPRLELFKAIMKVAQPVARTRHRLAHDLWCYSDDLPDALLLLETDAAFNFSIERNRFRFSPNRTKLAAKLVGLEPPEFPIERVFVYRENDLQEIIRNTSEIQNYFAIFQDVVDLTSGTAESSYRELMLELPIQESVTRLRLQSGNGP